MKDVLIIGAGPAGLAAAIYAQRAELSAAVLDRSPVSGGQVLTTYEVDNYPGLPGISGMDLSEAMRGHADKLGAEFIEAEVFSIERTTDGFLVKTDVGELETRNIIAATGAHHMSLDVPGEEDLQGMGVSYCATCDGAFFKGREVAVVGGGDVAVEDAIFLSRICKKVTLIHRRDELRAAASLQKQLMACENVEILWNTVTVSIEGTDGVTGMRLKNKVDGGESLLPVDGVFIAVGIRPNSELFKGLVDMDDTGYIIAGEDCRTSCPGILAAGDVRMKALRQIVTAAADGANAVNSIA